jgi:hypothetical protein
MRSLFAIALVAALACAGAANASVLTYQFTATVAAVGDPNIYLWSDQGEGALAGSVVRKGQAINGWFSYDNASTPSPWNDADTHWFNSADNKIVFTITSTGLQYQSTAGQQRVTIENTYGRHALWVEGKGTIAGAAYRDADASVAFIDNTMTKFPQAVLPPTLGMDGFSFVALNFNWHRASDGNFMMGHALIDTLSAVNEVPEPASLGLVLAGLTAFGVSRRRGRRA